jgi:hypothetical protein
VEREGEKEGKGEKAVREKEREGIEGEIKKE